MECHKPRDGLMPKADYLISDSGIAQKIEEQNAEILPTYHHGISLLVNINILSFER